MLTPLTPDVRREIKARLLALPPRAFELFAGDLLEFVGLRDVAVTRYSGDGGIDATGSLTSGDDLLKIPIGVQVKRLRANVQRPDIDRFIGALSGRFAQGMFITTAGYAPQAVRKAASVLPRVATVDGDQVAGLMLRYRLGITEREGTRDALDEAYFAQLEAQTMTKERRTAEQPAIYKTEAGAVGFVVSPEEDLISMRALSHALRIDTTALRRSIETGTLRPDQPYANGRSSLFRRDRIETIRAELFGRAVPADGAAWRQEFLDFARSRNLTKSYKPVMLKALLALADRNGEVPINALTKAFRAFYLARHEAGLPTEYGPPDIANRDALSDAELRQLIIRHPLERFLIKGFLEYDAQAKVVRFAPQLWHELRVWEVLDIQRSADEQLAYYYRRRGD